MKKIRLKAEEYAILFNFVEKFVNNEIKNSKKFDIEKVGERLEYEFKKEIPGTSFIEWYPIIEKSIKFYCQYQSGNHWEELIKSGDI